MQKLSGKKIVITGASSGIGEATAREAARAGATVILLARNIEKLEKIAEEIRAENGKAYCFSVDVSDYKKVIETAEELKKQYGIPDVLINNAGFGQWKFIEETSYEEVSQFMAVPYFGAFYMTKAFLPDLKKENNGQIINMTSYAGFIPFSGATAYIAARKAMIGFHEALSADLLKTGIKCSLAYFAKVNSTYWKHNQGSEERLPKSQVLIPTITPEKAAKAIVKGIVNRKTYIHTPFMINVINLMLRYLPRISKFIILKTGYYPKK